MSFLAFFATSHFGRKKSEFRIQKCQKVFQAKHCTTRLPGTSRFLLPFWEVANFAKKEIVMQICNINLIDEFSKQHPQFEKPLLALTQLIELAQWQSAQDISSTFSEVEKLDDERRVIFFKSVYSCVCVIVILKANILTILEVLSYSEFSKREGKWPAN